MYIRGERGEEDRGQGGCEKKYLFTIKLPVWYCDACWYGTYLNIYTDNQWPRREGGSQILLLCCVEMIQWLCFNPIIVSMW